jgi:hypothetical protein
MFLALPVTTRAEAITGVFWAVTVQFILASVVEIDDLSENKSAIGATQAS